jgi:hypothetical protein
MIRKISTIKPANLPTMSNYKAAAKASRGEKLKSMAGGGPITEATFPIRAPVVGPLPSGTPPVLKSGRPPTLAAGGDVRKTNVIHGKAAEREMAQMEREARADRRKGRA